MEKKIYVSCGIAGCRDLANFAAIVGTSHFCTVPAMNNVADPLPLLRYNLCDQHFADIRSNFTEVAHSGLLR